MIIPKMSIHVYQDKYVYFEKILRENCLNAPVYDVTGKEAPNWCNKSCQKTTTLAGRQQSWLKFLKRRSNFKIKPTRSKITVPCERSCHKE